MKGFFELLPLSGDGQNSKQLSSLQILNNHGIVAWLQCFWDKQVNKIFGMIKHVTTTDHFLLLPSLGWEDPLEKEMATHSSILIWRIPWTEEPDGLQSLGSQRVRHDLATEYPPIII